MNIKPFDKPEQDFTMLHNSVFDLVMRQCTPSEWKVLCAILRKTRGWQKESDYVSYSQLSEITGISSYSTIKKAINGLERNKMIEVLVGNNETSNLYKLNKNYEPITENVVPYYRNCNTPITETVDTKESIKESFKDLSGCGLLETFERESKIYRPVELIDPLEAIKWEREIAKWEKINVTDKDIEEAISEADKRNTTLAWPGSITKYLISIKSREKRGVSPSQNAKRGKSRETLEEMEARLLHPDSLEAK